MRKFARRWSSTTSTSLLHRFNRSRRLVSWRLGVQTECAKRVCEKREREREKPQQETRNNKSQQPTNKTVSDPQTSNDIDIDNNDREQRQQQLRHTTTTTHNNYAQQRHTTTPLFFSLPIGVVGVAVGHDVVGTAVTDFQTQFHQARLQPGHDRHSLLHGTVRVKKLSG